MNPSAEVWASIRYSTVTAGYQRKRQQEENVGPVGWRWEQGTFQLASSTWAKTSCVSG